MKARYVVKVWQGEVGSIALVVDVKRDRVMGETSTFRDGAAWRKLADIQCDALNAAVAVSRCRLRNDWRQWSADTRADRLFMVCPGCGVSGSHVAEVGR